MAIIFKTTRSFLFIHRLEEEEMSQNAKRILCYILGMIISLAVGIIPWFTIPITYISVIVSLAGAAMLVLCIIGLAKGWPCVFGR